MIAAALKVFTGTIMQQTILLLILVALIVGIHVYKNSEKKKGTDHVDR